MKKLTLLIVIALFACSEDSAPIEPPEPLPLDDSKISGHWIGSSGKNSLDIQSTGMDDGSIIGEAEWIKSLGGMDFDYTMNVNGTFSDPEVDMVFTGANLTVFFGGIMTADSGSIECIFIDEFDEPDSLTLIKE